MPADGAQGVDRRVRILVVLDRPILPRSITQDGVRLVSGERSVSLLVRADPLLPGLVVTPRSTLEPGVRWNLRVQGLRDLDGREAAPIAIAFRTGQTATPPDEPPAPGWAEVGPLLQRECGSCHGGPGAVLGLDLASAEGIRRTAIGVLPRGLPAVPSPDGAPLVGGLSGMPRIFALAGSGRPEQSYLVYKIVGDPHVVGSPMPPPTDAGPGGLSRSSIEAIARWIEAGAPTE